MRAEQNKTGEDPSASVFIDALISLNRLDAIGFQRLVFAPGMLFDRPQTWWPGGGVRPVTHEGLDVCFFETTDGRRCRLDETTRVPMAFDGEIVGGCNDFLGKTIIARHFFPESGKSVYAFYAHILPEHDLKIGDAVPAGRAVGRIAPVKAGKSPLPAHLHLTFAAADLLPPLEQLNWPVLNRLERSLFYDPLKVLHLPCRILSDASGIVDLNRYDAVQTVAVANGAYRRA